MKNGQEVLPPGLEDFQLFLLKSIIYSQWLISYLCFRMHSLKASSDNFPTSLILLLSESENLKVSVVGHSKISPMHRFPNACFIESGSISYTQFLFENLSLLIINLTVLSSISCNCEKVARTRLGTLYYARN